MSLIVVAVILAVSRVDLVPARQQSLCDLIELNHYISEEDGKVILDQFIFWVWDHESCRHVPAGWALAKTNLPVRVRDGYLVRVGGR